MHQPLSPCYAPAASRLGTPFVFSGLVLAKGAGPGVYNRWGVYCGGSRYLLGYVRHAYISGC
ncbi:hypothetical protein [Hydrogenophaga electricum]|uniref:Uncharacterized protein n=1 Tax=Hydrogenophaga electricum TaxID=1230953 RepID=A0ABQ6C8S5_9BURK|nr:hypothetical protein [Hydrogenophaga electricum]GLS16569.1 hypothetical protein GCM10007935_40110 [Hydrogenophaga electricum]